MRERLTILMRWVAVPFADRILLLALVSALAAPAFLVAAADHWTRSTADDATRRLAQEVPRLDIGLVVSSDALFSGPDVVETAAQVVATTADTGRLAEPIQTLTTFRALGLVGPGLEPVGVPLRIVARPGAIESLTVVDGVPGATGGVWISEWLADETGLAVGDVLVFESSLEPEDPGAESAIGGGPTADLDIIGVYETLWARDGSAPPSYWSAATPPGIVPTFIRPFDEPAFSLLVTDEVTLAGSGVTGSVRWDLALRDRPREFSELEQLAETYRAIQRDLSTLPAAVDAFEELSPVRLDVDITSGLFAVESEARVAIARLERPLDSARAAGLVIGVAVVVAAGLLLVQRRRLEYRLLAGEGERWIRIGARTFGQFVLPALIATVIGVGTAAAAAAIALPGGGVSPLWVDWPALATVTVVAVIASSTATGLAAQSTLDSGRLTASGITIWPALVASAASVFLWVQVARSAATGAGSLDLVVVALPIAALTAAVLIVILVLDAVRRRVRNVATAARVGPVAFLAVRRSTAERIGGRLTIAALGIGIGLLVFAWILTATLARTTEIKSAVQVGGEETTELLSHPEPGVDLPAMTSVVGIQATRITPGDLAVTIVAVDPATIAEAIVWPDEYGGDPGELVEMIEQDVGQGVAVVAIEGQSVPATGSFGTFQSFPYEVVGRFAAVPFSAPRGVTLVVSAQQLDAFELARVGLTDESPGADDAFFSPVRRFRPYLTTTGPGSVVADFIATNGLVARATVTRADITGSVDALASRAAFDYLRLLGLVGAVAGAAAIGLYLSMRRRSTALATVLTRRMGLAPGKAALVTTLEIGLLAVLATAAGSALTPFITRRLVPRFDPDVGLPPSLGVVIPASVVVTAVGVVVVIVAGVWLGERLASRRTAVEVLRDAR